MVTIESDIRLVYRFVLAVDIERYSARDAREQLFVQHELRGALEAAARDAGLDRGRWQQQVHGDGELTILPEGADAATVVDDFTRHLEAALAETNRALPDDRPLRVRLAIHHGTLVPGPFGPAGDAPVVVSRLLDAQPLRRRFRRHRDRALALIVSDVLYQDVVRTGFCTLDPRLFRPIRITVKGIVYRGHVYDAAVPFAASVVSDAPHEFV